MFTYFVMGIPFIALVVCLDLFILKTKVIKTRQCWIVMAIMLGLTAIFDQFLTGLPIVHYNEYNMTNIRLGFAPVEDFLYVVVAVIGVGSLVKYFEKR